MRELYDDSPDWEAADLVAVGGVEAVRGGDFSLTLGATISGRVADTGLLMPDMQVAAGPVSGDHLSGVSTDITGNYTLSGLPDGNIEVVVRG